MNNFAAIVGGFVFGFGLVISGMADPENVLAFLTLGEHWNPALIFVMGSAVTVTAIGYLLVRRLNSPLYATVFNIPANAKIDKQLIIGALVFGLGWGVSGYCPGPAIVAAFLLDARALVFGGAFLVGVFAFEWYQHLITSTHTPSTQADG